MHLRATLRSLGLARTHSVAAILTIALTTALGATAFAVVDGTLFRPLPYRGADQLFELRAMDSEQRSSARLSAVDVEYFDDANAGISAAAVGYSRRLVPIQQPEETIVALPVGKRLIGLLGHGPLIGGLSDEHFVAGGGSRTSYALISWRMWRQRFGGIDDPVGRTIDTRSGRIVVVGVLPRDFVAPVPGGQSVDVVIPIDSEAGADPSRWNRDRRTIVRIADGITPDAATESLDAVLASRIDEYAAGVRRPGPYSTVVLRPLNETLGAAEGPIFRLVFGAALVLVLLGALNVAALTQSRGAGRTAQVALQVALGASVRHLVHDRLREVMVIAAAGGVAGFLLSMPLLVVTVGLVPDTVNLLGDSPTSWRVFWFSLAAAVGPAVIVAVIPALKRPREIRQQLVGSRLQVTASRQGWLGSSFVAAEAALGVILVVAASLLVASYVKQSGLDLGIDVEGLALVELITTESVENADQGGRDEEALMRIRATPGVLAAAFVGAPILSGAVSRSSFFTPPESADSSMTVSVIPVSPEFFEVAGLRTLDGRLDHRSWTNSTTPSVAVSELVAEAYWPNERAIGKVLVADGVVGRVEAVIEEAELHGPVRSRFGEVYVGRGVAPDASRTILLRTDRDAGVVVKELATSVRANVPGVLVRRAESASMAVSAQLGEARFRVALIGAAGIASTFLLAMGVAGLVAARVALRYREITIRSVLGARRSRLIVATVGQQLRPVIFGLGLGTVCAWWGSSIVDRFLHQMTAVGEPSLWILSSVVIFAAAAVGALLPALWGTQCDLAATLGAE